MPDPEAWREARRAEEQRRRRRPADQQAELRRLTKRVIVAAAALNAVLFVQSGVEQLGPGDFQSAIVSAAGALFPGSGLQPAAQAPKASPKPALVTTGGS